jgi:endonuclease/exonuclease/phosphatase family metal-dependent hydrolase
MEMIRIKRTMMVLGIIFFGLVLFSSEALPWQSNEAVVKIMTQNVYAGTSLGFVVALGGAPEGVDLTSAEIEASDIPQRANLIAAKIAGKRPHIVALQEVALWRTGPTPETATHVLYDQLKLLLRALARRGAPYELVAVNTLTDLALPGSNGALRYTDRDALLVRSDLCRPAFHISNTQTHVYDAAFDFQGLLVVQGWISADVHVGHILFRLVATHLMSPVPGVPEATDVQVAQANELIDTLNNLTIPVVLCGDFNSDAEFGNGPDATPSVALIEAAGYVDTWRVANPSDPEYTWPLFLDDQLPPPDFFAPFDPFERIDLFFSRDIKVINAKEVFAPAPSGIVPPYGSDHAGVIATFRPQD